MGKLFLPNKHLILGNRLSSDAVITKSYIGLNGTIIGTPVYVASAFGPGMDVTNDDDMFTVPFDHSSAEVTVEFQLKPHFASSDNAGRQARSRTRAEIAAAAFHSRRSAAPARCRRPGR